MESFNPTRVDETRAAWLLGLTAVQLRRLSEETGAGELQSENGSEHRVFTYAELYRLCRQAVTASTSV